jgi:hypothetical protein
MNTADITGVNAPHPLLNAANQLRQPSYPHTTENTLVSLLEGRQGSPDEKLFTQTRRRPTGSANAATSKVLCCRETPPGFGLVDLADLPHGELIESVEGENGRMDRYPATPGIKVLAYDECSGNPVWADVAYVTRLLHREILVIALTDRRKIFTNDGPCAVYGIPIDSLDLRLERTSPSDALSRRFAVPRVHDLSNSLPNIYSDRERTVEMAPGIMLPLNWEFGYWLGVMAGDGWWSKKNYDAISGRLNWQWHIADLNGHKATKVQQIVEGLFPGVFSHYANEQRKTEGDGRYGDSTKHTFSDTAGGGIGEALCAFFSKYLGGERGDNHSGSGSKHLPAFAFAAPSDFREGMLCGLIDTDGACSVSNAKNKPQLMISYSSTAMKLAEDVKLLCKTLGIEVSICFGKETAIGNTLWMVTLSALDSKRLEVFSRLQTPGKKEAFDHTPVAFDSAVAAAQDMVPAPPAAVSRLVKEMGIPKVRTEERKNPSPEVKYRMRKHSVYMALKNTADKGITSRQNAENLLGIVESDLLARRANYQRVIEWLRHVRIDAPFDKAMCACAREAILACAPKWGNQEEWNAAYVQYRRLNVPLGKGCLSENVAASVAQWLEAHSIVTTLTEPPVVAWRKLVGEKSVRWASVARVEKIEQRADIYALVVPGYETFANEEGVMLSSSGALQVPLPSRKPSTRSSNPTD